MDLAIVEFCNRLGRGFVDPVSLVVCEIWFLVLLWGTLAGCTIYLDRIRGREVVAALAIGLALHFLISEGLLKHALLELAPMRIRPYRAHPDQIVPIGTLFADSSFPSSHNATSAAVAMVFASFYRRTWPLGLAFVLLMAFSRMHNGMHYPTDVLTGVFLGTGYALAARYLVQRFFPRGSKEREVAVDPEPEGSDSAQQ
jgi:membrane-associated phospholipid phosphatase